MRLMQATDFGDHHEGFVNGVAGIEEVAPGVVRVSFFSEKEEADGDEERFRKIMDVQFWSKAQLRDNLKLLLVALDQLSTAKRPELSIVAAMH